MARTLSDKVWAGILAAAKTHPPDADARAALSQALFNDYPTYDRERVAKTAERAERMLEQLAAFEADYRVQFPSGVWKTDQDYEIKRHIANQNERGLRWLEGLRGRTETVLLEARRQQRANARRRNTQREMLYFQLCGVWLDHFGGELTYDRSAGGEPGGPLVDFILMAMRQAMPEDALPSREAVRDNIDRERREREAARRVALQIRNRGIGV
jgi:hypothetical protein